MNQAFRSLTVLGILAVPAAAQLTRGFISGTITDSSGAVMANVKITITEGSTGVCHTALSNEAGVYRIVALEPGVYSVEFSKNGFETARHEGIGLSSAQEVVVNQAVGVAGATTSVTVDSSTSGVLLAKASPAVERTIERERRSL